TMGTEISFGGEEPLDLTFGPYTIHMKGRIDRVDQVEDGYEVIDYKSGRPRRFRRDFDIKLQYYLYTLAWEKLHPDQPIRRATYDLVDGIGGVEKKTVEMTDAVREDMNRKVTELLDLLADPVSAVMTRQEMWGDDFTCPDYCPFIAICDRIGFPEQDAPGEYDSAPEEIDFE
ncbi:MAG: PD-(D/E)XK nuclease family protein, partial [Eubacteriales bacterium]|nr:PD-(D/E)XK nuclease family protein [Eubacteriales bacterium]